jgi:hypothetical protein
MGLHTDLSMAAFLNLFDLQRGLTDVANNARSLDKLCLTALPMYADMGSNACQGVR